MRRSLAGLALLAGALCAGNSARSLGPQDVLATGRQGPHRVEIGTRVAGNFAARPFERPNAYVIYPEVCAWYGSPDPRAAHWRHGPAGQVDSASSIRS